MKVNPHRPDVAASLLVSSLAAGQTPECAACETESAADPAAIVTAGRVRFTVLTPQLIRLEWAADGRFEDRASLTFVTRRLPVPEYEVVREGTRITLRTAALTLHYAPEPGGDGRFTPGNLTLSLRLNGRDVTWRPGTKDTGNLLGTTRTLDRARGARTQEPMEPGVISRDGWVLVDDSSRPLFDSADFRFVSGAKSAWPWVQPRPPGERQDWYFFGHGHDYRKALGDFTRVAGKIPLPPRYAFGAWWSRYWAYADQELLELVRAFRANDVPLDVLVIDMDWHLTFPHRSHELDASGHKFGWTGYTWNRLLFPEPERFLRKVHDQGLKVTLNLHPASGVQPWEERYPDMARALGIDPASNEHVPFAITDRKFATSYFEVLHHPLEWQGVDFWWLDWQQESTTAVDGVNPTWWLNYVHFTDQQRQGKRPLLFHRWGGLGNHRYQIGFSGDTISVWESLAFQPWFTATAANVGYAYWSHDIGGHMPGKVEPELYLRWVQFGVFSPILRTHTAKNPDSERRIWAYPEPYSDLMRKAFHLRYALGPYLYTEARRTHDTGVAFIRPLYYEWPEADEAYEAQGQYLFGDQLMVAPVTVPVDPVTRLATVRIWIPPGEWYEWPTGRHLSGPLTVTRRFSLDQVPVYARGGAIVPMQGPVRYSGERPLDPLILTIPPLRDGQASTYRLYEDDGAGEDYQRGSCRWTDITAHQQGDELTVVVSPPDGDAPGLPLERACELRLPGDWPPVSVSVNGHTITETEHADRPGWRFEGATLETIVRTSGQPVTTRLEIRVLRAPGQVSRREPADGFAGSITRLRAACESLCHACPDPGPPDELMEAVQTATRLGYHPQSADAELARFAQRRVQARDAVAALAAKARLSDAVIGRDVLRLKSGTPEAELRERAVRFRAALVTALAQLEAR